MFASLIATGQTSRTNVFESKDGSFSITPKIGYNLANMSGDYCGGSVSGFLIGAEVQYKLNNKLSLESGLLYSIQGGKTDIEAGFDPEYEKIAETDVDLKYLNLPIMASYNVYKGLRLRTGIQLGYLCDSGIDFFGMSIGGDAFKKMCISIPIGASYEYKNFVLDIRYSIGLNNIMKNEDEDDYDDYYDDDLYYGEYDYYDSGSVKVRSNCLSISFGYKFTL